MKGVGRVLHHGTVRSWMQVRRLQRGKYHRCLPPFPRGICPLMSLSTHGPLWREWGVNRGKTDFQPHPLQTRNGSPGTSLWGSWGAWLSAVSAKTESWHFPFLYHVTLTFREIPFVLGVWRSLCLLSASFLIWLQILVYLADLHDGLVWCYNHFPILSQRNGCLTIFSFSWLFLMDFKARKNIKCPIIFN